MTQLGEYSTLLVEERAEILFVTLHRPDQRNAVSEQMITELTSVVDGAIERGDTLRVLVLQGSGDAFCAGGDLAEVAAFVVARVGAHHARRIMVTGARLSSVEAARISLVDEVVPDGAALAAALERVLTQIRRCAPAANRLTKGLVARVGVDPLDTVLDLAADAFADVMLGPEAREGVAAFAERRAPAWAAGN